MRDYEGKEEGKKDKKQKQKKALSDAMLSGIITKLNPPWPPTKDHP